MVYFNYVVLVHFIIIISSLIYSIYASLILLFKKPQKKIQVSRTPVVFLYFCFTASASILLLLYSAYTVIWWLPDEVIYNPNVLYFVAGLPTIYVNLVPIADFYLCIDRCFAFAFPVLFQTRFKYALATVFFATDFSILLLYFLLTKYFSYYTTDTSTTCVYYICLVWKLNYPLIMTYTKYVFCGLNLIISIVLLGLNWLRKSVHLSNKLNKPVIFISIINISFAFVPGLFMDLGGKVVGSALTEYLGDINLTCISISIALSVHIYLRVFKKYFLKSNPADRVITITA